jgi:predicted nucleotidyltransferase
LVSNRFEKEWRNLARNAKKAAEEFLGYRYHSPNVPMSAIRRYARQIVEKFQPDKIILFGSYAYGQPHEWSDVDILVDMPARNQIDQAIRIIHALDAPFPLDLIVRTPKRLQRDWEDGDWFLREVLAKGKVLYEKSDGKVGSEGRGRPSRGQRAGTEPTPTS